MINFLKPLIESYNDLKRHLLVEKIRKLIREQKGLGRIFLCLDNSNLSYEDLEKIIPAIKEEFPEIETLGLAQNDLDRLPDSLADLRSLKKLNLSMNNITKMSSCVLDLPNLTEVHLFKNPLSLNFLFEISSKNYSHISFTFNNSDREFLQKKQEEPSNTFKNVSLFLAEVYPDIDYKKISDLFDRLNNYQKKVVDEFKYSLSDVGVSFEDGDLSKELSLADTQIPLFIELLEKAYKIEDATKITFLEAVNIVKTKPQYFQGIIDFGLTVDQMDRLTSRGRDFLKDVYKDLAEKIEKKYYSGDEDEFDLDTFTDEDKDLARTIVDEIIEKRSLDIEQGANETDALGVHDTSLLFKSENLKELEEPINLSSQNVNITVKNSPNRKASIARRSKYHKHNIQSKI